MGRIDQDKDGNLAVAVENESDAAQLRATIKASDGADEVEFDRKGNQSLTLSSDNPFNFIALWATDFTWSPEAMKAALDCLVPVAQTSVGLHRRSQNKMLRRMTQQMTGETPKRHDEPGP